MFPRDTVCLRNISVDTLHKGETDNDDDNNNNNFFIILPYLQLRVDISNLAKWKSF
jgi:hypothetical protein